MQFGWNDLIDRARVYVDDDHDDTEGWIAPETWLSLANVEYAQLYRRWIRMAWSRPRGLTTPSGLATTEGVYDVEFRATDRLGRTTTAARCVDLHLLAPPLHLESTSTSQPTKVHAYALDSLSLAQGAQFDQIAARPLNYDATGASLIDQDVFNGTTSTIYLTVTVTRPVMVTAAQSFALDNAPTNVTAGHVRHPMPPRSPSHAAAIAIPCRRGKYASGASG